MDETTKASMRRNRDPVFGLRYFVGKGLDVGGGIDSLAKQITKFPSVKSVRNWDVQDGDAQYLNGIRDNSFDFVYSSHCLEHMQDPNLALTHWLRVLKPGGFLIISVPDEDMYEHGIWPSRFNLDHKWSFSLYKATPELPKSINILDLVTHFSESAQCERIVKIKDRYVEGLSEVDQTLGQAECAIEFVWQKQRANLDRVMQSAAQYEQDGREQEARDRYIRVIQEAPLMFEAYNRLTNLLIRRGDIAKAEQVWNTCVQCLPELHMARLYRALFLMSIGKYDSGFSQRDILVPDERRTPTAPPKSYPKWHGESLKDKSIVIWTEFGFGDEIMFARFVSVFKKHYHAKIVSIVCQTPLLSLFKSLIDVDLVLGEHEIEQLPIHDFWVFPHSIPVHYSLEQNRIPAAIPYFRISENDLSQAKLLLPTKKSDRLRVGFVSRGNSTHENDKLRSIADLNEFSELFRLPWIDWIDLQKGIPSGGFNEIVLPKDLKITHLGEQLADFMQTGAVCAQLDLLISVDTSVAHLAGALNLPVWLMLPTYTDWRWGVNQSNSSWYPSMRIFRQQQIGQWASVVSEIRDALCERLQKLH